MDGHEEMVVGRWWGVQGRLDDRGEVTKRRWWGIQGRVDDGGALGRVYSRVSWSLQCPVSEYSLTYRCELLDEDSASEGKAIVLTCRICPLLQLYITHKPNHTAFTLSSS